MKLKDKQAYAYWEKIRKATLNGTPVENLSPADMIKHREKLEGNIIEWCKFFFPQYARAEFAPFHKRFLNRVNANDEWYEVLSWSRELAKSTLVMFAVLFLTLTGRKKNVILTSASLESAQRLLEPYRIQLDSNQRIIAYYGNQRSLGNWEAHSFSTTKGVAFLALGAGQSPRGTRKEDVRPDILIADDFDTDEDCRNAETIKKKWNWFEQALYATRSIDKPLLAIWCGNIIAKDCCITRAGEMADSWDVINIRDKEGKSTWSKNSETHIDRVLSKISTRSAQQEYFNNPLAEGDIFKELTYLNPPPISNFKFIINYGDPSPSNSKNKAGSFKSVAQIGYHENKFYVLKMRCDHATNEEFVQWFYDLSEDIPSQVQVYNLIENNSLQNPFYEQVLMPLFLAKSKEKGHFLNVSPDSRAKPDKYSRIEGNLQPLNNAGRLIFNLRQKEDPHMKRTHEQFLLVSPSMKAPADAPDAVEGGTWKVQERIKQTTATEFQIGRRPKNKKRL